MRSHSLLKPKKFSRIFSSFRSIQTVAFVLVGGFMTPFVVRSLGLVIGTTAEESEVARRVRMFWRSLGPNSEAPMYGADTIGTLFAEDDDDAWNVGKLVRFPLLTA